MENNEAQEQYIEDVIKMLHESGWFKTDLSCSEQGIRDVLQHHCERKAARLEGDFRLNEEDMRAIFLIAHEVGVDEAFKTFLEMGLLSLVVDESGKMQYKKNF